MSKTKISNKLTQSWSSQTAFILAAVGSAVGLGNIWKFPYITGENGGGAFVLVYLVCILLIGIPVLIAEISLGKMGNANPVQALNNVAKDNKASKYWMLLGVNGVIAGFLILSFYTVIAGWAVSYLYESLSGAFHHISVNDVQTHFDSLLASPEKLIFWHTIVILFTIIVVSRGVRSGLEKSISFMMPGLFLILLLLVGYAITTGSFGESLYFLFNPDFSKLTWSSVLVAMGHAFFTLSIGMGTMMVYGSYIKSEYSIVKAGIWIAFMDTLVALLAGLVIFSIVFANNLEISSGPGLLFKTLPVAFGEIPGGWLWGSLFFLLVVVAALSSAISLIEPSVRWMEQSWNIKRQTASWVLGIACWFVGLGTVFSFNSWSDFHIIGDRNFFDTVDFITANIMLPLGGLLMAVFMGWNVSAVKRKEFLKLGENWLSILVFDLRYVAVIAVIIVFSSNIVKGNDVWIVSVLSVIVYILYAWRTKVSHKL